MLKVRNIVRFRLFPFSWARRLVDCRIALSTAGQYRAKFDSDKRLGQQSVPRTRCRLGETTATSVFEDQTT